MPPEPRARHGRRKAHSLGSIIQSVFREARSLGMIKRLFFAVLGFWLLKKYVKPYFDDRSHAATIDET
jgi:hypothetical protein